MKTDNTALEETEISEEITCTSGNIQRDTTHKRLGDTYFARSFLRKRDRLPRLRIHFV